MTASVDPALSSSHTLTLATYSELKRLAAGYLRRERPDHTLEATALVHEAYLRLQATARSPWQDETHFLATAAITMRRILTDHARRTLSQKRGGGMVPVPLEEFHATTAEESDLIRHLDEALTRLARFAPRQAHIVELRFFGGMTDEEIARHLRLCTRTVKRDWLIAKAWLYGELAR